MLTPIPVEWRKFPLRDMPVIERIKRFGNPRSKPFYSPQDLADFATALRQFKTPRGLDSAPYAALRDEMAEEIRQLWSSASPANCFVVNRVLDLLLDCYPLSVKPRMDGLPAVFHPLWLVYAATFYCHFDSVRVCMKALHDIIEDSLEPRSSPPAIALRFTTRQQLLEALMRNCPLTGCARDEASLLARAIVWDVGLMTNNPLKLPGPALTHPNDFADPKTVERLENKICLYYRPYLHELYNADTLDGVMGKSLDSLHNLLTLSNLTPLELRQAGFLDKACITCIKENEHIDLDRKLYYTIPHLALEAENQILANLREAYPDLPGTLHPGWMNARHERQPRFRYYLYWDLEYYNALKSSHQLFFEHMGVNVSPPRSEMSWHLIDSQPYAAYPKAVITIQSPEIRDLPNLPYTQIHIQVPGRLARFLMANPGDPSQFIYLDGEQVQLHLQAKLGDKPFEVRSIPSLFGGTPLSADFWMYELAYTGQEPLLSYFGKSPVAQMEGYRQLGEQLVEACKSLPLHEGSPLTRAF